MKTKSAIKKMFAGNRETYYQIPLSEEFNEADMKMSEAVDIFLKTLSTE